MSASPSDITLFLAYKDKGGRTKVHRPACQYFGVTGPSSCNCPKRLAAKTVDNLIGKLRSIFIEAGRSGEWNDLLGMGNPAAHHQVKQYLKLVSEEQAEARVVPKQATPIFVDKLSKLCSYLRNLVFSKDATSIQRFLYARDLAFFCIDFYAGDRASDLGKVYTKEIFSSQDGNVIWFRHTFGKTLRGGGDALNVNRFPISRCQDPVICPVSNLNLYVNLCDLMKINLRDGYLFRALNDTNAVSDSPFVGAAVANRLKTHLQMANIHGGETMHSFRSGCAITLSLLGVSPDDIARHVGWKSLSTMEYYPQTRKVMRSQKLATTLASSTSSCHGNQAQAIRAAATFDANNELTGFKPAF